MPKLKHYDNTGTARFITFNCYRNEPSLKDIRAKNILLTCLKNARDKHKFLILGYVIMPEHVHLVIHPPDGTQIGRVIGEIKSLSAREWFRTTAGKSEKTIRVFWQRRCYDHNCRTRESVREKIEYCHNNPVRRGLVEQPENWPWSSYNWYEGKEDVPLKMDIIEF